jgi:hypothetical protein
VSGVRILFWSCFSHVLKASCTEMTLSVSKLGKFSIIILLNCYLCLLHSLFMVWPFDSGPEVFHALFRTS